MSTDRRRRGPSAAGRLRRPTAAAAHSGAKGLRRSGRAGAVGEAHYGAAGVSFLAPAETRLALFELVTGLVYPDLSQPGGEHITQEPTPWASARQLWCHHFHPQDQTPSGEPIKSYGGSGLGRQQVIYHPGALHGQHGYAVGHPAVGAGQRVFCLWNRQSGRWEMLTPPLRLWRFELKEDLAPGQSAAAYLLPLVDGQYQPDVHVEFTVHDALSGMLRGRGPSQWRRGTRGYARLMPDSGRWEILALEHLARWVRFALTEVLSFQSSSAAAEVLSYWDGYDPDPQQQGIVVLNCATSGQQYLFAGQIGAVGLGCYDPQEDKYRIVQLECP